MTDLRYKFTAIFDGNDIFGTRAYGAKFFQNQIINSIKTI